MTPLETRIAQTVIYLDTCHFAPTLPELYRFLLHTESEHTFFDIDRIVHTSALYAITDGYISLRGHESLSTRRKEAYLYTEEKKQRDAWILRLLSIMPGVRGVWLCNTLGWGNVHKNSDTDICVVAASGHIWTARFWTTFVLRALKRRPGECSRDKAICPSFYIVDNNTDLAQYALDPNDIHFAFWITQMTPLYNTALFEQWSAQQQWARSFFAHDPFIGSQLRHAITLSRVTEHIRALIERACPEKWLKRIQLQHMPQRITQHIPTGVVVLNDDILKLHTHDNRAHIKQLFVDSCAHYHISNDLRSHS